MYLLSIICFYLNFRHKEEEKNKLESIIITACNNEKNTQEKLNEEEIKRGQYVNEEKHQAIAIQNQNQNLSDLAQKMYIDCKYYLILRLNM